MSAVRDRSGIDQSGEVYSCPCEFSSCAIIALWTKLACDFGNKKRYYLSSKMRKSHSTDVPFPPLAQCPAGLRSHCAPPELLQGREGAARDVDGAQPSGAWARGDARRQALPSAG